MKELGIVTKVGPNCTKIKVGDRVGVGYMYSACGQCEYCISCDKEILCVSRVVTSLVKPGTICWIYNWTWRLCFTYSQRTRYCIWGSYFVWRSNYVTKHLNKLN
nr:alcohol dehydrogenase catalytic domain-containing protein [Mycoplasmopsis bovis]